MSNIDTSALHSINYRLGFQHDIEEWAALHTQRANILVQLPGPDTAVYIEQAIESYEKALTVRTREADPVAWARTMSNFAVAWRRRIRGERAENLERGIECLREIGDTLTPTEHGRLWASSQANLANALAQRIQGDPRDNIEQSISHYRAALTIFTRTNHPALFARCTANLAQAYQDRIAGDRSDNLEQSIGLGIQALDALAQTTPDTEWARLHNNLGAAYRSRLQGNTEENTQAAIGHYQQALTVWTRDAYADDWSRVQHNLGIALRELAPNDRQSLLESRAYLNAALEVRTPDQFPTDWLRSLHSLALTESALGNWQRVEELARQSLQFLDTRMNNLSSLYEMRRLTGLVSTIKNLGVMALSQTGTDLDAFRFLMAGRDRIHRSILEHNRAKPFGPKMEPGVIALPEQAVLIAFCALPLDSHPILVFLARTEPEEALPRVQQIELPDLNRAALENLFESGEANPTSWLNGYRDLERKASSERFKDAITTTTSALSRHFSPLLEALQQLPEPIRQLRFAPSSSLALFPFSQLPIDSDRRLGDRFEIVYQTIGKAMADHESGSRSSRVLAATNPTGDLPFSQSEGMLLNVIYPDCRWLSGPAATRSALLDQLSDSPGTELLHLSCHGRYQWRHPEQSGLLLANQELLSFSDITDKIRLAEHSLVVLPACETAVTEYRELPDETYGLPLAFKAAGADTIIATLWPVPDRSSKLLMFRFYEELSAGASPAKALRTAQTWLKETDHAGIQDHLNRSASGLRKLFDTAPSESDSDASANNYAHPFYWAGFICIQ